MNSLLLALLVGVGYVVAYNTYGRFLGKKIFQLAADKVCPSHELRDDIDFVPTNKHVLFGHHFTSIAGLGPIVGPAVALIWGWVPAMIWVFVGSIFLGAVHDFGALIVSLRHNGRSIGDISGDLISPRVRILFLLIIFFLLLLVIAVFALVIAILFDMYPQAVIPVWLEIPIAVILGYQVYKKGASHTFWGIIAVIVMYITVVIGAYVPVDLKALGLSPSGAIITWMIILYIYAYIASTLPVQTLLQPRDYINSHQLLIALGLLALGVIVAHPQITAPAINPNPQGAPSMWPFLFVIIACGAISGFHSLVSSGTSSKQCYSEEDARFIGYGAMLMEGSLSTLVIISVAAGLGLGLITKDGTFFGTEAFTHYYSSWAAVSGLGAKINAFVQGGANLIESYGIPKNITVTIMGVFLVSFAATTLDTATRLQRYIIGELAIACKVPALAKRHPATMIAVLTAFILSFYNGSGKGALTLWPLFGTANQLLAGLALLVITVYLVKKKIPTIYTVIPMVFMIAMTGWAMVLNLKKFYATQNWILVIIGGIIFLLEIWMIIEAFLLVKKPSTPEKAVA
ncbi:MAG: carbon starvation protein [Desulfonauticus sp.]|jgi:carbon starvation protein|nr:carbon starvation protein [Desulfonauticus sp.]